MTPQRLVFIIPDLSGGGAARVACILCGEWIRAGHEVHLVTYEEPGTASFYPLDVGVIRHQIGWSVSPHGLIGFACNNAGRVLSVWRVLRQISPTAVLAFLAEANMAAVLAGRSLGLPVIVSERNHPARHRVSRLNGALRRRIYPLATRLCVQTEDIRDWFRENLHINCSVIPNPVAMPAVDHPARKDCTGDGARRRAVSLGRLEPQKGFDLLLQAFALIASKVPEWDVVIHGEGGEREALEHSARALGLANRVFFPGVSTAPMEELRASDLYVHPARFEGFPNALLEALSAGLCVVATDCPGATREILQGGEYGILTPDGDTRALADALSQAMRDQALRTRYASKAGDAVRKFAPSTIAALWIREVEEGAIRGAVGDLDDPRTTAPGKREYPEVVM